TAWLRAERSVFGRLSPADFRYGDPRGAAAFRRAVVNWLARNRGIRAGPDEVIIVAGGGPAPPAVAPGVPAPRPRPAAPAEPGAPAPGSRVEGGQRAAPPVPVDASGLRVSDLRASGAPAALLTPAHQFPTGVVLDGGRRRELIAWASDGGLIIEDDYDAEHRY